MPITHAFVSAKPDGSDPTLIKPSNWNAEHIVEGIVGEQGPPGPQGEQGETGPPGPQGEQGLQGERGIPGEAGEQGIQGLPGNDGAPGAKGDQGEEGIQGVPGAQGEAGTPGAKGDTGDQGPQGYQGEPGAKGDTGDTGAQGEQGIQGIQGEQGIQGVPGSNGISNYTIPVQALTSSPGDGATVYFGMLPKAPTTTANISKCYLRGAGTIKRVEIYVYSGTAGTNENWSLYVRKNNTTDTLIATVGANTNERVFTNAAINISMASGDYFEIKGIQPSWSTNPLTTIYGGYVYIEEA
jgi:hypothetical protein